MSPGNTLAIANAFASVGADVAICGRTESTLVAAAEQLRAHGTRVRTAVADVRDPDALKDAIDETAAQFGSLDTVVAGAAGNFFAPAESISAKGFRAVIEIDLLGSFHAAHGAFEHLKSSRGSTGFAPTR